MLDKHRNALPKFIKVIMNIQIVSHINPMIELLSMHEKSHVYYAYRIYYYDYTVTPDHVCVIAVFVWP